MNDETGFLIAEDEDPVAAWLTRTFRKFAPVERVATVAAALALIDDRARTWLGLVTDIGLPDGSGLDVARQMRARHPQSALLVLTGSAFPKVINGSFALGASFLAKPTTTESLEIFARRTVTLRGGEDARVLQALADASCEWSLSEREGELLACAVADHTRRNLASALGIAENTAKTHIRSLLRKTGARSVDQLVHQILRRALSASPEWVTRGSGDH